MLTRATAIAGGFTLEPWFNFKSKDYFPADFLPTKKDVLQKLLHEENWRCKDAV